MAPMPTPVRAVMTSVQTVDRTDRNLVHSDDKTAPNPYRPDGIISAASGWVSCWVTAPPDCPRRRHHRGAESRGCWGSVRGP